MGFFTLQEIRTLGNKIACDTFVRNHKITNDEDELFRCQDPCKRDKEVEPEPDLQIFEIRMHKLEDPAKDERDDLKQKNGKTKSSNGVGQVRNGLSTISDKR